MYNASNFYADKPMSALMVRFLLVKTGLKSNPGPNYLNLTAIVLYLYIPGWGLGTLYLPRRFSVHSCTVRSMSGVTFIHQVTSPAAYLEYKSNEEPAKIVLVFNNYRTLDKKVLIYL